jgi:hypothetical protein
MFDPCIPGDYGSATASSYMIPPRRLQPDNSLRRSADLARPVPKRLVRGKYAERHREDDGESHDCMDIIGEEGLTIWLNISRGKEWKIARKARWQECGLPRLHG